MNKLHINSIEPNSKNYFGIYELLFYPDYRDGHAYFERELEKGSPSLGHHALAKILAGKIHNLAITTNFDSLIEDALFIYTNKRPLVVGHESLTEFINLNMDRPIIAKIHRSLYFRPFNRQQETDGLATGWQDTLKNAFMVYTPIVIGYAGGDHSLMKFLQDDSIKMNGLYWCYWNKEEPSEEIIELVKNKNGCLVPIDDFDQMMFMLSRKLAFENPEKEMREVTEFRIDGYNKQYDKFEKRIRQEAAKENSPDEAVHETLREIDTFYDMQLKRAEIKSEKEQTAESYFEKGSIYNRMLRYTEAIADYSKAIELKPDYSEAYNNRGDIYDSLQEYEKAIADYTKVIELKPDYSKAYNNRGYTYNSLQEYEKAIVDFTKAIELKPDFSEAYNNRGYIYDSLQEYEKALVDYTKAIELKPDDPDAFNNRGCAYNSLQEHEKAIADYTKAIELKPDNSEAYNNRGCTYADLQEYEKAITDYTKAIELEPGFANPYKHIGTIHYKQENYPEALAWLSRAIERDPKYIKAFEERANVYQALGQLEKASEDEETARSLSDN